MAKRFLTTLRAAHAAQRSKRNPSPRSLRCGACAALLLLALLTPGVHAARMTYGDVEVIFDFQPGGYPSHGYSEYRIVVANKGTERPHRVRLEFPGTTFAGPGSGGIRGISRSVEVGPGQATTVSLLQPAMPQVIGSGLTVWIDGRKQDDQMSLNPVAGHGGMVAYGRGRYARPPSRGIISDSLVLTSQRVGENFIKVPGLAVAGMPGAGAPMPPPIVAAGPGAVKVAPSGIAAPAVQAIQGQFLRAEVAISGWSDRWLAYSRYDGILVTREDLEELERGAADSKAILLALHQYVETGGTLVVLGPGEVKVPASWKRDVVKVDGLKVHRAGFGNFVLAPDRNSGKWSQDRWQALQAGFSTTSGPWKSQRNIVDLNEGFRVVDELGIPIRGLFALMIVFAIAIGPANLIVLSRKNKRIWLLWTVPVLSAMFCLMVLGYMIVAEGWQGHARVAGFTILDETERRATTVGKTAFYSPMTPGDGLRFSEDTEVLVQGEQHPAYTGYTYIDWTGEQHLSRGWVTARVPAHFTMRKSKQHLERLTIRKDTDGAMTAVNALGANLTALTLADETGQLYQAGEIAAGASAKLVKTGTKARAGTSGEALRRLYAGTDWAIGIETAVSAHKEYLGPNMYVAVLEESPFLEQALKGAMVRPSPSIVVGIMAELGGR